jgi:hypothetical protein
MIKTLRFRFSRCITSSISTIIGDYEEGILHVQNLFTQEFYCVVLSFNSLLKIYIFLVYKKVNILAFYFTYRTVIETRVVEFVSNILVGFYST